jgi:hypothetical protein
VDWKIPVHRSGNLAATLSKINQLRTQRCRVRAFCESVKLRRLASQEDRPVAHYRNITHDKRH